MSNLPKIASLWIGGDLSFLEQLCLKSFADRGHDVTLYSYEKINNLPAGVKEKDASEIYPATPLRVHFRTGSPAIHADFFRLYLMQKFDDVIWVDTDAYCYKPFEFPSHFVFGHLENEIANGVLRLPQDSKTLGLLIEFLNTPNPIPPFMQFPQQQMLQTLHKSGFVIPFEAMPWATTGPHALTFFLKQTGEIKHALPEKVLYPMTWDTRRQFLKTPARFMELCDESTLSFHFLGRVVRRILSDEYNGLPKPGSILDQLCNEHGIDPTLAPIPQKKSAPKDAL